MAAISAGGKNINFDTGKVTDKKKKPSGGGGGSSSSGNLQYASINPNTGEVTYKDSGIKIVQGGNYGRNNRNINSDVVIQQNDTKTGNTTMIQGTAQGQVQQVTVRDNKGKILSNLNQRTEIQRQLNNAGLGFLSNSYTQKQLKAVYNKIINDNNREIQIRLNAIDQRQDLMPWEKQIAKEKVIGISSQSKNFIKKIKDDKNSKNLAMAELIKLTPDETIQKKFINGETLTPTEQEKLATSINKNSNNLTRQQIKLLKNAPKDIVVGLYEVGKEIVMLPISAVKVSYDYGVNIGKRIKRGEDNPILNDVKKVGRGTKEVATFVKNNPKAAAAIVGTVSVALGKNMLNDFIKNPVKTMTKAVGYFYSGRVISKGISFVRGKPAILEKYSKIPLDVKTNLVTGAAKIEGRGVGVLKNKQKFTTDYKLRYDPKTKIIEGEVKTKIGKKTIAEKVKLVDEGGYYKDLISGQKVSKAKAVIDSQKIKIRETKVMPKGSKTMIVKGEAVNVMDADITTIVTNIFDKTKKVATRSSEVRFVINPETKKTIFGMSKQFSKAGKKTRTSLAKGFSKEQVEQLESFLKSIDYDKVILNGMDKRTRLARALGLRKDSKLLKSIESIVDDNGSVKGYIKRTGTAKIKATLERGVKPAEKKVRVRTRSIASLKKNKKGSYSFLERNQIEVNVPSKTKLGRKGYIEVPELKAKLPLTPINLRYYGVSGLVEKVVKDLRTLNKKEQSFTTLKDNLKDIKKGIAKIQGKIREKDRAKDVINKKVIDVATKKKTLSSRKTKNVPTNKVTPKTINKLKGVRVPTISPKVPPIIPKIKTPKGKSRDKRELVRVTRKGLIEFKEGNRIRRIKTNLPYDKALKIASKVVDNSVIASMTVKPYGKIPKSKAVGVDLSKFTTKKGKNPLVRKIVEKSKYRIDKPGEKKGLKAAKLLKKELMKAKAKPKRIAVSKIKVKAKIAKNKTSIKRRGKK